MKSNRVVRDSADAPEPTSDRPNEATRPPLAPLSLAAKAGFGVLLALVAVHSVVCAFLVPIGMGADEQEHLDYAFFLAKEFYGAEHPRLPDPRYEGIGQIQHPPLPYLIYGGLIDALVDDPATGAPAWNVLGRRTLFRPEAGAPIPANAIDDRYRARLETPSRVFYWLRLPSILLGVWTLLLLLASLRYAFPSQPLLAVLGTAVLGLTPNYAFQFAMISNDPWMTWLAALVAWYVLRTRFHGRLLETRTLLVTSVLVGLAFLTKLHAIGVAVFIVACIWSAHDRKTPWTRRLLHYALLLPGPGLVAGWWHVRQVMLLGSPLALSHHADFRPFLLRLYEYHPIVNLDFLERAIHSFFGTFGQENLETHALFFLPMGGLAALGLLGLLFRADVTGAGVARHQRAPMAPAVLGLLVLVASILVANRYYYHIHGRYLYAYLVPLMIVLIGGLQRLLDRSRAVPVLLAASAWNLVALIFAVFVVVLDHYTIPLAKLERGHVVAYYDCGNRWFDQEEAGGALAARRYPLLHRPSDTMRFAIQVAPEPELIYRTRVPDASRRYQVRVRYPSPYTASPFGGDVPSPSANVLIANKWIIHGPHSLWNGMGELHFPLAEPIVDEGTVAIWWQNHHPASAAVGCAELWIEEAWLQLERAPRLVRLPDGGSVEIALANSDDVEAHHATLFVTRGEEILASEADEGVRLEPGEARTIRLRITGDLPPVSELALRLVDRDQAPWASAKLVDWRSEGVARGGSSRVPDNEIIRHSPTGSPTLLAVVPLPRVQSGLWEIGITHPSGRDPFRRGQLEFRLEGAEIVGTPSVRPAAYGQGLELTTVVVKKDAPGETTVNVAVIATAKERGEPIEIDRLIVRRDPSWPDFGQRYRLED